MSKVILFNGKNLDGWKTRTGEAAAWRIDEDGAVHAGNGDIVSDEVFGDAHLHVEFKEPNMPDCEGQAKGNSGVYVHGCYEIQVLDSYGISVPKQNDCAAVYELFAPRVNACLPPETWQTYDIIVRAPRYNNKGEICEAARLTLIQNGTVIHNNIILHRNTPGGITDHAVAKGPLMLQDHGDDVCFRNVWVEHLD